MVTYTVYGDVLAAVNFIIDLALIKLTARLTRLSCGGRIYIAAGLGAAFSFMIFLPPMPPLLSILVKLGTCAAMLFTAFGRLPRRVFMRAGLVFFAVSFLACGAAAGLVFLLPTRGVLCRNGAIYFAINPLLLLISIAAAYAVTDICGRLLSRRCDAEHTYTMTISRNGAVVKLAAFADSGNRLVERFSGLPVIIAQRGRLLPLLTVQERIYISTEIYDALPPTLRPVVFGTVGGGGVLLAFRAQGVCIASPRGDICFDAYIAAGDTVLEACDAVFNPDILRIVI